VDRRAILERRPLTSRGVASQAVIQVESLKKMYKKQKAVNGISFEVGEGEIFGLIGADGAGKSSVMKILAGVLSFDKGNVTVLNHSYPQGCEKAKSQLAFMPQGIGLNLYMDLSVHENIQFFADLRQIPRHLREDREDMLLRITGLSPFRERLARDLSGGMQQKLGLCCSLVSMPRLLMLDEPTTGVDPISRRDFWELLFRFVNEESMTVLLSTSYMEEAERCHKIAFMMDGEILFQGTPEEIQTNISGAPGTTSHTSLELLFLKALRDRKPSLFAFKLPHGVSTTQGYGSDTAVSVTDLSHWFGGFQAVRKVSLDISKGEIFGLLGPNGAGKTTVIKAMVGLLDPSEGEIVIAGLNRKTQLASIKHNIGYMSQKFSLYRDLTVLENIELYATLYGLKGGVLRARKRWILQIAELEGQERKLTREIPLGMRQRLALGCALVHLPSVVFLDEPTSGVDPLARERFWDIITRLSKELETTFLVTTHHLVEAEYCQCVALMNQGSVVALGSPMELKRQVIQEKGHMAEIRALPQMKTLELIREEGYQAYPFGRSIHIWMKRMNIQQLEKKMISCGIKPLSIEETEVSMEDVFVHFIEEGSLE
jgi:ABC-type multidrug transport system ATPase subunit